MMLGNHALVQDLRARITRRHLDPGDGLRGGVVLHEVNAPDGKRRADTIAVNFKNRNPPIVGYEIKVSRQDWLQEILHPEKAVWADWCTQFWVAAATPDIVAPEELPDGWGLVVPHAKVQLRTVVKAATTARREVPVSVMVEIMKKADTQRVTELGAGRARIQAEEREYARKWAYATVNDKTALDTLRGVDVLIKRLGLGYNPWEYGEGQADKDLTPTEQALWAAARGIAETRREYDRLRVQVERLLRVADGTRAALTDTNDAVLKATK